MAHWPSASQALKPGPLSSSSTGCHGQTASAWACVSASASAAGLQQSCPQSVVHLVCCFILLQANVWLSRLITLTASPEINCGGRLRRLESFQLHFPTELSQSCPKEKRPPSPQSRRRPSRPLDGKTVSTERSRPSNCILSTRPSPPPSLVSRRQPSPQRWPP